MARYEARVEDGTIYVGDGEDRVAVGDLDSVLDVVGGPAWTISYSEREKARYPDLDTSDEGLTIDVVDAIHAMTFDEGFVDALRAQPSEPPSDDALSPRLGLFVGRLFENLQFGVR